MMDQGDIEGWLARANSDPWTFLSALQQPDISDEQRKALQAKATEDHLVVARAWKDFAATPGGMRALQRLMDQTVNRAIPPAVALGLSMEQVAMHAQFREGQNNVAHMILKLIAQGRNPEDQPQPRDVS